MTVEACRGSDPACLANRYLEAEKEAAKLDNDVYNLWESPEATKENVTAAQAKAAEAHKNADHLKSAWELANQPSHSGPKPAKAPQQQPVASASGDKPGEPGKGAGKPAEGGDSLRGKTIHYKIDGGDVLTGISARFGVSVAQIKKDNGIGEDDKIITGKTLVIKDIKYDKGDAHTVYAEGKILPESKFGRHALTPEQSKTVAGQDGKANKPAVDQSPPEPEGTPTAGATAGSSPTAPAGAKESFRQVIRVVFGDDGKPTGLALMAHKKDDKGNPLYKELQGKNAVGTLRLGAAVDAQKFGTKFQDLEFKDPGAFYTELNNLTNGYTAGARLPFNFSTGQPVATKPAPAAAGQPKAPASSAAGANKPAAAAAAQPVAKSGFRQVVRVYDNNQVALLAHKKADDGTTPLYKQLNVGAKAPDGTLELGPAQDSSKLGAQFREYEFKDPDHFYNSLAALAPPLKHAPLPFNFSTGKPVRNVVPPAAAAVASSAPNGAAAPRAEASTAQTPSVDTTGAASEVEEPPPKRAPVFELTTFTDGKRTFAAIRHYPENAVTDENDPPYKTVEVVGGKLTYGAPVPQSQLGERLGGHELLRSEQALIQALSKNASPAENAANDAQKGKKAA